MIEIDSLMYVSKNDIPFFQAQVNIHQPTIKEIAYINEENFLIGVGILTLSKEKLSEEGKRGLEDKTDFDILMVILNDKENLKAREESIKVLQVLTLIFPSYKISISETSIDLMPTEDGINKVKHINNYNFKIFQDIISVMFSIREGKKKEFNPSGEMAKRIAAKLKKGREKAHADEDGTSIFNKYLFTLSVGLQKNINSLLEYTVPQLFQEYEWYLRKLRYDSYVSAKLAGAQDIDDVPFWTEGEEKKDSL